MGFMSGTSMAAPLVANYASKVLHQNPHLTTLQLKQILMKTVDKKSWLINMVKSEGVINLDRAMLAAKLMQNGKNLTQAVSDARKAVKDKYPNDAPITLPDLRNPEIRSLYFSNLQ
jgi:subtilisin family serine protease